MTEKSPHKIELIRKKHRNFFDSAVTATSFVGLMIDGEEVIVAADTPIVLNGGPGPTSITLTLLVSEFEIIDREENDY